MKRWSRVLAVGILLVVPSSVLAGPGASETGDYSVDSYRWEESYRTRSSWLAGPACYYGQDVRIIFDDLDGNLIDTQLFHVTERFFDAGADASARCENGSGVSYQVSAWWDIPELERYEYIRKIPGVYEYRAWNRSGDWERGWVSGECQQGWSSEDEDGDWSFDWP